MDCGSRWELLAAAWAPRAEEANCAFNDLHAMLAFVGSGRRDLQRRLLGAQTQRLSWGGTNRGMLREVGLPACRGLAAFGAGDYARAERLLRDLPAVSHRLGGSHAQRGLIGLTYRAARKLGTDLNFSASHSFGQCWSLAVMCAYLPSAQRKVAEGTRPGCSVPSLGGTSPSAK